MTKNFLLKIVGLSVVLDDRKILDNVSFEIKPEEILAIIGPNGCGKTVLLKTILGLIPAAAGEIEFAPNIKIGYLPQRFHVDYYLPMTVEEFLKLKPKPEYSLKDVLELVNANEKWLKRNLGHLSSGELQKILLAWAILDKPKILLFDEPTENVDVVSQESIYELIHHLKEKMDIALIIVSHDLHMVYRHADHVLCLNQKMICYGEPEIELTQKKLAELYGHHAFFKHHHYNQNEKEQS